MSRKIEIKPDRITVSVGVTKSMNFNSVRADYGLEVPVSDVFGGRDLEKIVDETAQWCADKAHAMTQEFTL